MNSLFPSFLIFNFPAGISILVILGLFVAGLSEIRQGHIGRVSIFLNAILLWEIFYNSWNILPTLFQFYLNLGTFMGAVAIFTYIPNKSLPSIFYKISFVLFGSLSLILSILGAFYFKIPLI